MPSTSTYDGQMRNLMASQPHLLPRPCGIIGSFTNHDLGGARFDPNGVLFVAVMWHTRSVSRFLRTTDPKLRQPNNKHKILQIEGKCLLGG